MSFTTQKLVDLCSAYNRAVVKRDPRARKMSLIPIKADHDYLVSALSEKVTQYGGDSTMQMIVQEERPAGPGASEWLSNEDIDGIMRRVSRHYAQFRFLGAIPMDCEMYAFCSLHRLDFSEAGRVHQQFGAVFNLDRHGQRGSHWVAFYVDLTRRQVYFSDSTGKPPRDNINNLINKAVEACKAKGPVDLRINTHKYQHDRSECGVYSTNFIIRCLAGESFDSITRNALTFEQINSCRQCYFKGDAKRAHQLCDPKGAAK